MNIPRNAAIRLWIALGAFLGAGAVGAINRFAPAAHTVYIDGAAPNNTPIFAAIAAVIAVIAVVSFLLVRAIVRNVKVAR